MVSPVPTWSHDPPVPARLAASGLLSVALTTQALGSLVPLAQILACTVSLPVPTLTSSRIQ